MRRPDHYRRPSHRSTTCCAAAPTWPRVYVTAVCAFFQAEDGIRDATVTGVQTCALPIFLLEQDLVYVGGGCVRSMLGAWRAHGLDAALRQAWAGGGVMCGLSAGSLCWFEHGLTAFHGEQGLPVPGLGLLTGSNAVHYDKEPRRR